MRSIKSTDQREAPIVYFDIQLDDMGLTVYEYRAYGRIARRASGGQRACTESLEAMARGCQMSRPTLVRAIRGLINRRMIARDSKLGDTSTYYLTDKSNWVGKPEIHPTSKPEIQGVDQRFTGGGKPEIHGVVNERSTKNTREEYKKNTREERGEVAVIPVDAKPAKPLPPSGGSAGEIAREYFPQLGIWQQDLIENADINHMIIWRQCCERWRDNRYSLRNITGLIDSYYKHEAQHANSTRRNDNGQNRRESHNERAARETRELIEQLTGQTGRDGGSDSENPIFELPPAFRG
jgi:hypothetical protein